MTLGETGFWPKTLAEDLSWSRAPAGLFLGEDSSQERGNNDGNDDDDDDDDDDNDDRDDERRPGGGRCRIMSGPPDICSFQRLRGLVV